MVLLGIFNDSEIIRKLCLTWFALHTLHNMSVIKNIYSDFVIKVNGIKYIRDRNIYGITDAIMLISDPSKFGSKIKEFMLTSRHRRVSVCYGAESIKFIDASIAKTTDVYSNPYGRDGGRKVIMPIYPLSISYLYRGIIDTKSSGKLMRTVSIDTRRMMEKIAWSKAEQMAWLI